MAADDMYQYSPGIVTNILARQKAEARQAMLDELNSRQAEATMKTQAANAASLEEQRQAMAEWRQSQADENFLKDLRERGPDYEPSDEEVARITKMGRGGLIVPPTTQEVIQHEVEAGPARDPNFEGPINQTPEMVEGEVPLFKSAKSGRSKLRPTYAQQQDLLERAMLERAMKDPNIPASVKQYYQFPKGDRPTASLFEQPMDLPEYDPTAPEGQRISNLNNPGKPVQVTSKNRPVMRSRPPQGPQPQIIQWDEPDGKGGTRHRIMLWERGDPLPPEVTAQEDAPEQKPKPILNALDRFDTATPPPQKPISGFRVGNTPAAASQPPKPIISDGAAAELRQAALPTARPGAMGAARARAIAEFSQRSPDLANSVRMVLDAPNLAKTDSSVPPDLPLKPIPEIIGWLDSQTQTKFTEQEKLDLANMLAIVLRRVQ